MRRHLILLGFVCIVSGGTAWADEKPLEQDIALFSAEQEGAVVVSAARYKQVVGEAPASVTIISAREIHQYGWRTLADVLRSVRGFYVSNDRNYSYLGDRGFSRPGDFNTRVLALLNGHVLNDDIYDEFLLGRESGIDLDIVDRIEIVRGPGSALYGTSAFFVVINIVTKEGSDFKGLRASAESGSYNTNKGLLTYGEQYGNGLDLMLHASRTQSGGQTLYFAEYNDGNPAHDSGFAKNSDGESVSSFFGELHYKDFGVQGIYFDRSKEIPTASYFTVFNDGREETVDSRYFLEFKYNPQITPTLGLMARAYDDWYGYKANYPIDYPPLTINKDNTPGRWYGTELQLDWKILAWNRLVAGTEGQYHQVLLRNFDEDPFHSYLNVHDRFQVYSVYLQDEMQLMSDLTLTAGIRHDLYVHYNAQDNKHTTPRAALVYEPLQGSAFKLLYGQAFRVPNGYELLYCGVNYLCNTTLKSEKINTYEGEVEQTLGPHLKGSLSVYRYDIKDLINLTDGGTGTLEYQNIERVWGNGVETELRSKWASGIESYINYTYQIAKDRDTHQELSNSPRHLAKAGQLFPLSIEGGSAGIEEQYVGSRKLVLVDGKVDPYFVTNLTLTFRNPSKNFEVQTSINNLFNARFSDPASNELAPILQIPQDGRNFYVKITAYF
ncbi:MAG TPA: TonB-dependent receptor [Nitrospiria bacterium]|nr:TonB-dependent receptor [Nitrospiria bacterium]